MGKPADRPVAVYRFNPAALWISLFAGLLLQISLPIRLPLARLFDFPLVLAIYYSILRRSKFHAIVLGAGIGLVQDALSHGLIGVHGISVCLAAYLAASVSVKLDLEQLGARYALTAVLVCIHSLVLVGLQHILFETQPPFIALDLASTAVVNTALALICFPTLDRFRVPL